MFFEDINAERLAVDIGEGWPSASLWSDEGGLVVGSHGMSDENLMRFIGLINRLWDGLTFERRRLTMPSVLIKGRRLTVSMMMQPVVFTRLISAGDCASRGMGWIARILVSWPTSTIGARPYRTAPDDMPALDGLHQRLRELLDLELPVEGPEMTLVPPVLGLASPAFTVWRTLHDEIETELSRTGEFGAIPDIGAKIAENAARLAAIFHVVGYGPGGAIDAATMQGAAAVAVWHLNEARRILGASKTPQDVADADLLLEWLLRQPQSAIEPREILRLGPPPLRNKVRRDNALKVLIEKIWVREVKAGEATQLAINPKARGAMNLVDRWLSRSRPEERVATPATSATSGKNFGVSADFSVVTDLRQVATLPRAPTSSSPMSQPVADRLRHENPQDAALVPSSRMSQLSQDVPPAPYVGAETERAAIVEYDSNVPREWAEGSARLDPDRPPSDVPVKRWQRFVDDVGLFLDSPFCAVAAALGWGPHDLFGCDRDRPYARIDQAGLLWLLKGNRLVALSENTATIESRTGTRPTYRRRPSQLGQVLAWELAR